MNCERYQVELEDFLYGELKATRVAEIQSHLAVCADCRRVRADLERESEVFARYYERAALEPSAEMWAAIREQISGETVPARKEEHGAGRWRAWLSFSAFGPLLGSAALRQAAFAAILVVVSVTATALYFSMRKDGDQKVADNKRESVAPTPQPTTNVTPAPTPSVTPGEKAMPHPPAIASNNSKAPKLPPRPLTEDELIRQQLARAEREYQSTIRLLDQKITRRKDSLDPTLLAQYHSSLALIDNSIAASRRALREAPKDSIAAQFLLAAYARKVELMEEVAMR